MGLTIRPIVRDVAFAWVAEHHRHHKRQQASWLFGTSLVDVSGQLVGVACVGRPARQFQDGVTCEVTRVCTDGTRNACSMLYSAVVNAAKALGYSRIYTYTRLEEDGASARAAGFVFDKYIRGGEATRPSRTRAPVEDPAPKCRWVWPASARDPSDKAEADREQWRAERRARGEATQP